MNILVAGASGAIGHSLLRQLQDAGHTPIALTRSSEKAIALTHQGAIAHIVDIFDAEAVQAIVEQTQPDVVVDLLTALPKRYSPEAMAAATELDHRTRRQGGGHLLAAAQASRIRRYILQSSAFWYAPGAGLADETAPFAVAASPAIAAGSRMYADIETRLFRAAIDGIALRYGFLYGPGTWYAADGDMATQVRQQQFPIVDQGQAVWSWIHVEDAAAAVVAAIAHGEPGAYNIVDDQPSPVATWLPAYADWLGAAPPPQVSLSDTLKYQGADAAYYATQLRGATNAKAKAAFPWQPRSLEWLTPITQS